MKKKLIRGRKNRRGFTLIEVLLVLVILVVVGAAAVYNFAGIQETAYKNTAKTQINDLKRMLTLYQMNVGLPPNSLDALFTQPGDIADASKWTQISDKPIPPDPWGHPFEYKVNGSKFEIRCIGPDGQSNTQDDITG